MYISHTHTSWGGGGLQSSIARQPNANTERHTPEHLSPTVGLTAWKPFASRLLLSATHNYCCSGRCSFGTTNCLQPVIMSLRTYVRTYVRTYARKTRHIQHLTTLVLLADYFPAQVRQKLIFSRIAVVPMEILRDTYVFGNLSARCFQRRRCWYRHYTVHTVVYCSNCCLWRYPPWKIGPRQGGMRYSSTHRRRKSRSMYPTTDKFRNSGTPYI